MSLEISPHILVVTAHKWYYMANAGIREQVYMASHESSKKSIRKTVRQRSVNVNRLNRIRTFIKKVEGAISSKLGNAAVVSAFSRAQKEIMKGASKNIMHKNAASRRISRLNKRVKLAIGEEK
jgi:small subunit ribosomal protein S20